MSRGHATLRQYAPLCGVKYGLHCSLHTFPNPPALIPAKVAHALSLEVATPQRHDRLQRLEAATCAEEEEG